MSNLIHGDCIEEIKKLPDNSVDAIITDPPYFFGSIVKRFGDIDSAEAQWGNDGSFNRLSKGFMGKQWDGFSDLYEFQVFSKKWATECLRVLKPGAYLLSFGGTRTYHRMVCGIEDAGFEIRDTIMWVYGSGFPKSLNIGKQIDKIQGNKREVIGESRNGSNSLMGGLSGNKTETIQSVTKGNSEWEGWGTALKPAVEPIVVARKPLSEKNVALNVLKWGTGGINIDESRVEYNDGTTAEDIKKKYTGSNEGNDSVTNNFGVKEIKMTRESTLLGRFPANLIHDNSEEVRECFPESKGAGGSIPDVKTTGFGKFGKGSSEYTPDNRTQFDSGSGNASRFFKSIIYQAKASKSERNYGCDELEEKIGGSMEANITETMQLGGASPKGEPKQIQPTKNNHPTVKPVKLMEYLIKLVSKENAIVLDPFLGSGTTAIACLKLNRQFIGIEKEPEYIKIAQARIKPYLEQRKLLLEEKQDE